MNLQDAVRELESKFTVAEMDEAHFRASPSMAPSGDKYVVVCSGGVKEEGETYPAFCNSEDVAVRLWLEAVYKRFPFAKGTLHWRIQPEMETFRITVADQNNTQRLVSDRYAVYSRLVIVETKELRPDGGPDTSNVLGRAERESPPIIPASAPSPDLKVA